VTGPSSGAPVWAPPGPVRPGPARPASAQVPPGAAGLRRLDLGRLVLALFSGAVAELAWATGRRGVDVAAQLYRVEVFRHHGFTLWDSQWYGGHWTLDYSVLYPPLGALVGMGLLAVVTAVVATAAFDQLVVGHFGLAARLGSAVFALSVVVETSIGQLAFFTGEAFGLVALCCLASARRRWVPGALAGAAASLCSPLAGAFTAVAVAGWALTLLLDRRRSAAGPADGPGRAQQAASTVGPARAVAVAVVTLVPLLVTTLLFPGQGPMPYPVVDWLWEAVVAVVVWRLLGPGQRVIRTVLGLYLITTVASVTVPSALGGNVGRLEDIVALPLAVVAVAVRRGDAWRGLVGRPLGRRAAHADHRVTGRWGIDATGAVAVGAVLVTFTLSQWSPAWGALTTGAGQPWTGRAFFTPMVSFIEGRPGAAAARVEVVPTHDHGEVAYVAPRLALARGWDRQLDIADNPLFYGQAPLTQASYLAWLRANGVRWVALSDAPQDAAGVAEARLVSAGVPGLQLAWSDARWRVYRVNGPGIVSGPARLADLSDDRVSLVASRAATVEVRVRWAAHWRVTGGAATLGRTPGGWLEVTALRPGPVSLQVHLGW
jgi:hypothetical protein